MAERGVRLRGVRFGYGRGPDVLKGVDADAPEGAFVALAGPNGSGKSTLLQVLAGLLTPRAGEASIAGVVAHRAPARERARAVAYLPQHEPADAPFTVRELALMARYALQGRSPFDRPEDEEAVRRAAEATGVAHLLGRLPSELSGGERQRAWLARALACAPPALLLDEPSSSLDPLHQVETYRLLRRLNRERGATLVVAAHDLNLSAAYCDAARTASVEIRPAPVASVSPGP